jgi:hypothetical protein
MEQRDPKRFKTAISNAVNTDPYKDKQLQNPRNRYEIFEKY